MPDADGNPISTDFPGLGPDEQIAEPPDDITDVDLAVAGLPEGALQQVLDAVHDADSSGTLPDLDLDQTVLNAQAADDLRNQVQAAQHEEARAINDGDFEKAHDFAIQAEQDTQGVLNDGGVTAQPITDLERDTSNLDWANYHQEIADSNANSAAQYAAEGEPAAADVYAPIAESEAVTADDLGHNVSTEVADDSAT
jgi:hypothetical protein